MKLSKHENHRNADYLKWLRKQPCAASGQKAECAHHIRIGTNGGSSLKPSDYFCIPLTNEHHTTGLFALHVIGEDTFLKEFKLKKKELFVYYLKSYLLEKFEVHVQLKDFEPDVLIAQMIKIIEENGPKIDRPKKKKKKKVESKIPKQSITENEFYQKAKEAKKVKDRELRLKIKEAKAQEVKPKVKKKKSNSLVGTEFYERAKEEKRLRDKELRRKMKTYQKSKRASVTESDYYQKAKELKRIRDKEFRDKLKEQRKANKTK